MADVLSPGSLFGPYRIERPLGRGGMSAVYLAEDTNLRRKVALKVIAPELADTERFRERFVRESQLAASLDAPNVLPVYEAGERDGVLFIAMRYVEGLDLKARIAEGPLSLDETVDVIGQVALALDAAHARGLVHRDVKPANILLARTEGSGPAQHVYLSDFGLTKRSASDSGLTGTGVFVGTLDYAAPEQFEGRPLDPRTDVYSLGCVLYECLTGRPPFRAETDASLMYAHLQSAPPLVTADRTDLPRGIDSVVVRAMAKTLADRYRSAGELAEAVAEARSSAHPADAGGGRRRGGLVATAVAVVALVAIGSWLLTRDGAADRPEETSGATTSVAVPPSSIVRVDAETGETTLTVPDLPGLVSTGPFRPKLAIGEGRVWLHSFDDRAFLLDLDPETGEVRERTRVRGCLGCGPPDVAVGSRTVWQSGAGLDVIQRLNPLTYEYLPPVRIPSGSVTAIALGDDILWVGSSDGTLFGFDALTGDIVSRIEVDATLDELAVGRGSVWGMNRLSGEIVRVDPDEEAVIDRLSVPGDLSDIAGGDAGVWVLDRTAGTITRIDDPNAPADPVRVGPTPSSIVVGLGSVWVTDEDGQLYRVDPQLGAVGAIAFDTPLGPLAIDEENGAVWVGTLEEPTR